MSNLIEQIDAARSVSTPIIAVTTPDQPAIVVSLVSHFKNEFPVVLWDRSRGFTPRNDMAVAELTRLAKLIEVDPPTMLGAATSDPSTALKHAALLVKRTVLICMSMDRFLHEHPQGETIQAALNLRDAFKTNQRTLIMLAPDFDWPREIQHDVILLNDPLPDNDGYGAIIKSLYKAADLEKPTDELVEQATLAVRGLSAFEAEQVIAMSISLAEKQDRVDLTQAWEFKKNAVAKVKGMSMTLDGPDLKDLRGLDQITATLESLWNGPCPPQLVVRVDEIDKSFAGLGKRGGPGDNTGVTDDLHQQFLTTMEEYGWNGAILYGVRGSGKTVLTQSIGKAHGVPTIALDTGAMKGSHVGESERAFRDAFRTIHAIGGERVLVLATANRLDVMTPELLRRFKLNIWFFDLLSKEERDSLWPIYLKKYGHKPNTKLPEDEGWTGAEIRNACELAYLLRKPVEEVGRSYIIPITKSDPLTLQEMRSRADGRFFSVARPGAYSQVAIDVPDQIEGRKLTFPKATES